MIPSKYIKFTTQIIQDFGYIFALLCVVFIPFTFHLTQFNQVYTTFIFEDFLSRFNIAFFNFSINNPTITSDSTTMYLLLVVLSIFAFFETILLQFTEIWKNHRAEILDMARLILTYYIASILLKYGFDKIFKGQFYLPEPNTLYTPLGNLSKDLLYWSTMGLSYSYTVFLGVTEVVTASLLLFRRTRFIGLLFTIGIFTNIIAINFGFDISVKIYSCLLGFISIMAVLPYLKSVYQFFIQQRTTTLFIPTFQFKNSPIKASLKTFIIGLFLLEALFPYVQTQTWNDDIAPRPFLHGAYQVIEMMNLSDSTLVADDQPIKRFFIHRHNYLILQNQEDKMVDYKLQTDTMNQQLFITDYNLKTIALPYQFKDSILTLDYSINYKIYQLKGKALDWKKLPALQSQFHWRME